MTAYDFELSDAKLKFYNFDTLGPPSAQTGPLTKISQLNLILVNKTNIFQNFELFSSKKKNVKILHFGGPIAKMDPPNHNFSTDVILGLYKLYTTKIWRF